MTTFLAKLDFRGSILLSGADSIAFLQGQTTCNLDELSAEHSLVGAYCNPQGRMVCDFRLWQLADDRILLGLEADTVANALTTFGKYIVFSKAEMEDASADYVHYALWGDAAERLAKPSGTGAHSSWQRDGILWTSTEMDGVFEACVPQSASAGFEAAMTECDAVSAGAYRQLEIEAGIGHVTEQTSGMFLPQMLNYQHTGRISFTKGCYTGQEVVARLQKALDEHKLDLKTNARPIGGKKKTIK